MPPFKETETTHTPDSERVRRAMAAGVIVGTWSWDVARDRLHIDESLAHALGLDPALARGPVSLDHVVGAIHPDDEAGLEAAIAAAIRRGGRYVHQYRARGADGAYRWLEAIGRVDLDAEGRAVAFPGVLLDIDDGAGSKPSATRPRPCCARSSRRCPAWSTPRTARAGC